ncbi:neuroligin-4, Y-linked-like [Haliotis asinina]|uniref:neuroligin-4, Y-linked-like n=1 Tax=Haliotis asinina TaxID=109174 RepID=UPI0035318272
MLLFTSQAEEFVVRDTHYGRVRGIVNTVLGSKKVERYLGIPYAAPPVGELRFENPEEPSTWKGVRNTTTLSPACPQRPQLMFYLTSHRPGFNDSDEDCLYMNIYVPQIEEGEIKMAVLVHIHGGSNQAGMGAMLDVDILAAEGEIIVVNFNYTLGALGFLSGGKPEFPGNYGLLDQTAALQWVSQNIHFFGGDPNKVTVEGHSAGAADVGYHIVSPLSKGLFRFAIIQSGSPTSPWASGSQHPEALTSFGEDIGCNSGHDLQKLKQCLKTKTLDEIRDNVYSSRTDVSVPHGRDLFYLFGCPFSGHPLYYYTNEDRQISKVFMNMWINFVKTG